MIGIALLEALCLIGLTRLAVVYHRESQPALARHRGKGRMSWVGEIRLNAANRVNRIRYAAFIELTMPTFDDFAPIPDLVDPAPGQPIRAYDHSIGAGRYAHLRTEELDSTAERELKLTALGLPLRSPFGTPEQVDEWIGAAA